MDFKRALTTMAYRLGQVRQQLGFVQPLSLEEKAEIAAHLPFSALPLFQSMSLADQRHALRVFQGLKAHGCTEDDMLAAALLHDVGKAEGRVPFWTRPAIVLAKIYIPRFLQNLVVYLYSENENVRVYEVILAIDTLHGGNASRHSSISHDRSTDTLGRIKLCPIVFENPDSDINPFEYEAGRNKLGPYNMQNRHRWKRALAYAWYHAEIGAALAAAAGLSPRTVLYIRTHHQADGPAAMLHEVDEVS
jgi:hypothetical protein